MTDFKSPKHSPSWDALTQLSDTIKSDIKITDLITQNIRARQQKYVISSQGMTVDFTQNLITDTAFDLLCDLARDQDLEFWRDQMFAGDHINLFEDRAVLHSALRAPADAGFTADGQNIMDDIDQTRQKMRRFVDDIHQGRLIGQYGDRFTDIVNIGIGGSYLGPEMVYHALSAHHHADIKLHFIANIDGHDLQDKLKDLNPRTTLFVVASKTFTTQETMTNATSAKKWLLDRLNLADSDSDADKGTAIAKHFIALSTNIAKCQEFGIDLGHIFPFWDWVGGRFSLWSSIGLPIALGTHYDVFQSLLDGAYHMDNHFRSAPLDQNIPIIMGLMGIWYRNFMDCPAMAVLPYDQRLDRFPAYLQQLDMESNGKSVDRNNHPVDYHTGPIIFGEPGTNGQHAFYQLIHQGTTSIPCDFIGVKTPDHDMDDHHKILLAHLFAQRSALINGRDINQAGGNPQKLFPGNKPSNLIMLDQLTPFHLGQLIAAYEHKIFVQGIIWNLNSFDQWGVELGKEIASGILSPDKASATPQASPNASQIDPITQAWIDQLL